MSNTSLLLNMSDVQQIPGFTPRYAEHFIGAAALVGAFGLVFGAMALGLRCFFACPIGSES